MLKRVLAVYLCLVICVSFLLGGCGASQNQPENTTATTSTTASEASSSSTASAQEGYTLPLTKTGETLTIATPESYCSNKSLADIESFPIFKESEKVTGIKLSWEVIKPDYTTVIKTRLAAGGDLPDIITLPSDPMIPNYIDSGLFAPLSSLIDKNAPNIKKFFELRPDVRKMLTYTDKEIYLLPDSTEGLEQGKAADDFINANMMNIRGDLLKKLNMSEPTTKEALYQYLTGIKKLGNIPYGELNSGANSGINCKAFLSLYGIPVGHAGNNSIIDGLYEKDGKIVSYFNDPKFMSFLTDVSKWYKEGLIKAYGTGDTFNADIISGKVSLYPYNLGAIIQYAGQLKKNVPDAELIPLHVPDSSNGTFAYSGYTVITKSCKNPKLALQWLDYVFFTDKGMMDQIFGFQGQTYEVKDGTPGFTADFANTLHTKGFDDLYGTGAYCEFLPHVYKKEYRLIAYKTFFAGNDKLLDSAAWFGENVLPTFPKMLSTNDELNVINQYVPDLSTYIAEMITKFITGAEPLSNYDTFLKKLDTLGYQKLLGVQQAQYDRFLNN